MQIPSKKELQGYTEYQLTRLRDRFSEKIDIYMEAIEIIDDWVEGNKEKFGNDGIDYRPARLEAV